MPIHQPPGQLQAGGQHIASQFQQLNAGHLLAQEVHPDLIELVRLIKYRDPYGGQQFGHTRFAHRHIREKKMVVDHHHIRRHGLLTRQVHMACPVTGAGRTQAVVAGRGDQGPPSGTLVQSRQLGHVPGAGGLGPGFDFRQRVLCAGLRRLRAVARLPHAVQTQVIGAAFEQGDPNGQAQDVDQTRNVARKQLVLQGLGGGGHQRPLAAEQNRHQIRIGFAHPGTGFHHELATLLQRLGHRQGHVGLALARLKARDGLGQFTLTRQGLRHPLKQAAQGNTCAGFMGSRGFLAVCPRAFACVARRATGAPAR